MIYGNLKSNNGEIQFLPKALLEALDYLKSLDFSQVENGRYDIRGDDIYAMAQEYDTKNMEERPAEQHRDYVDVQYLVSGEEMIGVGYENESNETSKEYEKETDAKMYSKVDGEVLFHFKPGMFFILFPKDIHRPGLSIGGQSKKVRKVVVKVGIKVAGLSK